MNASSKTGSIKFSREIIQRHNRRRTTILITVVLISMLMGFILALPPIRLTPSSNVEDIDPASGVLASMCFSVSISLFVGIMEMFIFNTRRFRSLRFLTFATIRMLSYLVLLFLISYVISLLMIPPEMQTTAFLMQAVGISLIISFLFNSVFFIKFFVGGKALLSLMRGKYHNVREEKLIVFFIDMASSTKLGESLSPKLFFSLLSDFMYVVETCTSSYGGFLYKYLGDGAIITWKANKHSFQDALATVREMKLTIENNAQYFSTKYGQSTNASAGLHYGQVMVGELGEERRELGYLGDTVNTASRLQSACHDFDAWVLVSRAFYEGFGSSLNMTGIVGWKEMGNLRLKGKQEEVSVLEPQFN